MYYLEIWESGRRPRSKEDPHERQQRSRFQEAPQPSHHGEAGGRARAGQVRSEEHTSELQSRLHLVCRLLLEKKKKKQQKVSTQIIENISGRHTIDIRY